MIAKINDLPFYGTEYINPVPTSVFYNLILIGAKDRQTGNQLLLSKYMKDGNENSFIPVSSLYFAGGYYYIFPADPYKIIVNQLSDTLIEGSFLAHSQTG